jgi:hypothetical protein
MIKIKENDRPKLPHCSMVCDSKLHEKLDKYELTSYLNTHTTNLLIGRAKSGKTSLLHSLFEHKGLLRYCYNNVFIFQPLHSGKSIEKNIFDKLPDDQIYHELNFENLYEVQSRIEESALKNETSVIIFDDMASHLKNKETLKLFKNLIYNRRHLRLSLFFLVQSFYAVPKELRRMWSNIFCFRVTKDEMKNLWGELIERDEEYIRPVMRLVFNKPFKFLFVNVDSNRLYDGWDEIIFPEDEEDD